MPVDRCRVEVVYALAESARVVALEVPAGTSIRGAIERSRVLDQVPAALVAAYRVGIFGVVLPPDTTVADGDRIEIYRPLLDDAKGRRRRQAARQRGESG